MTWSADVHQCCRFTSPQSAHIHDLPLPSLLPSGHVYLPKNISVLLSSSCFRARQYFHQKEKLLHPPSPTNVTLKSLAPLAKLINSQLSTPGEIKAANFVRFFLTEPCFPSFFECLSSWSFFYHVRFGQLWRACF